MLTSRLKQKIAYLFLSPERYARYIGVQIGKGSKISTKCFSSEPYLITIGNNVRIAKNVCFFTHGGIWALRKDYPNLDYFGKIFIGDNCYIGQDAKILPGVTIEDNCIIAAGSVVTKSVKKGMIVGGNPAKYISKSEVFLQNKLDFNCQTKGMSSKQKKQLLLKLEEEKFIRKPYIQD